MAELLDPTTTDIRQIAGLPTTLTNGGILYADGINLLERAIGNEGEILKVVSGLPEWAVEASGGHIIQDEGTPLTARANLNIVGSGITATDDIGNDATVVTLAATVVQTDQANTYTAGAKQTITHSATTAGLNLGVLATDPSSPVGGDIWINDGFGGTLLKMETSSGGTVTLIASGQDLGTPSAGVATNLTGTAAGLTAGTVTTNANLTGDVTSVGNATTIAAGVVDDANIGTVASTSLSDSANIARTTTANDFGINAQKFGFATFTSTSIGIQNGAGTFEYLISTSSITDNRILTLPLLGASDEFVFVTHAASLANKTFTTGTVFASAPTINPGTKFTFSQNATTAGLSLGNVVGAPSGLSEGDIWYNSTTDIISYRAGASTQDLVTAAASQTLTNKTLTTPTIGSFVNATHDHADAAGGGTIAFSATTGIVAIARGGSGQTTQQEAIDALTNVSPATNEFVLTKDTGTGNALWKAAIGSSITDFDSLTDVTITTPATGDMYYKSAGDTINLAIGSNGEVLKVNAGIPSWQAEGGGTTHDMLSATHPDTVAQAVSRGSIIIGNATPLWDELTIGTVGQIPMSDGTDIAWASEITNQTVNSFTNFIGADEVHKEATNRSGGVLTKGDAVFVSGFTTKTDVDLSDADAGSQNDAIGVVEDVSIANNADGHIIISGTLTGFDTSFGSEGNAVYISTDGTSGNTLTVNRPTGVGARIQKIGQIVRSHPILGEMQIVGAGRSNDVPNLEDGHLWIGNVSNLAVQQTPVEAGFVLGGLLLSPSSVNFFDSVDGNGIMNFKGLSVGQGIKVTLAGSTNTQIGVEIPDGQILIGDASTNGLPRTISGDVTINNLGVAVVADDSHAHTNSTITLASSDLSDSGNIPRLDASNVFTNITNRFGNVLEIGDTDSALTMERATISNQCQVLFKQGSFGFKWSVGLSVGGLTDDFVINDDTIFEETVIIPIGGGNIVSKRGLDLSGETLTNLADITSITNLNGVAIGNYVLTTDNLSVFAATTSAQLAGIISDETGGGPLVFAGNATLEETVVILAEGLVAEVDARTYDGGGSGSEFIGRNANGTIASPTVTVLDDALVSLQGYGWNGASSFIRGGLIQIVADATFTATSSPGRCDIFTTPVGSTNPVRRLEVSNAGLFDFKGNALSVISDITSITNLNGVAIGSYVIGTDNISAIATSTSIQFDAANSDDNFAYEGAANAWGTSNQNIAATGKWQEGGVDISPIGPHDSYIGAGAFRTVSAGAIEFRTIGTGDNRKAVGLFPFTNGVDTFITTKWIVPENYNGGPFTVVVDWISATEGSGDVIWAVAAVHASDGDNLAGASTNYGTEVLLTADVQSTVNFEQHSVRSANITPANTYVAGDSVYIRVQRRGNDAGDTFAQIAQFVGLSIRMTISEAVAA